MIFEELQLKDLISFHNEHFFYANTKNRRSLKPREVVFLDETWIYSRGNKKSWQDNNVKSVRKPEGYAGKRFIVVHAGSMKRFIPEASLLFCSKFLTLDYHGEMNSTMFIKWITLQLLPSLEEPSLIIMDNAPYHSEILNKQPTSSSKKSEIVSWLHENKSDFDEKLTKPELLHLAKMNRKENIYIKDELVREHGDEVLRLLPYHPDFNAKLIWADCKTYYNKYIGRDGYSDEKY
ncbi:uncharacterized protein [Leptinotarsa decemlineata]|uniref:uncharacterized protein n=1 Tax=Leptinotarsa decemlineata TaxID=7539 RepID=UPI003D309769